MEYLIYEDKPRNKKLGLGRASSFWRSTLRASLSVGSSWEIYSGSGSTSLSSFL